LGLDQIFVFVNLNQLAKMAKSKSRKDDSGKAGTGSVKNDLTTRPHTYDQALATLFEVSVSNPASTLDVSINDFPSWDP